MAVVARRLTRKLTSIAICTALLLMCLPGVALGSQRGMSPAALGQRVSDGPIGTEGVAKTRYIGVVTDAVTGSPIEGAMVYFDNATYDFSATTDATGHYVLDTGYDFVTNSPTGLVPPGEHDLYFWADGYDEVVVTSTAVLNMATTVDVQLTLTPDPGTLTVSVKNAATNASVGSEYWVSVYQMGASGLKSVDGGGSWEVDGIVSFDLPPGIYYLWATAPGFSGEFYLDTTNAAAATPIVVTEGGNLARTMNLSTAAPANFDLDVTDAVTGAPLEGITAEFLMYGPTGERIWLDAPYGDTDVDGNFAGTLAAGTYAVRLTDFSETYASEYLHDAILESDAETFTFTPGGTLMLAEKLAPAASISGTNFDSNGDPYPALDSNNSVQLYSWNATDSNWEGVAWTEWNQDGTYDLGGIASGTYRAESYAYNPGTNAFESVYYAGATSVDDITLASDIVVTSGQVLTGIHFRFNSFIEKPTVPVERISGTNRYATALATSKANFTDASTVVLATGTNFPDALSASALAGAYGGPLLLTAPNALSAGVAAEITRLGATDVVIIGSESAVSLDVEDELAALPGVTVDRVFGENRYETSAEIAYRVAAVTGGVYGAFVVRGDSFADALSASPIAYRNTMPIILTESSRLRPEAAGVIGDLGIESVYIAGSTNAVSAGVFNAIEAISPEIYVERISGTDRYATSANVAAWGVENGYSSRLFVGVATGLNFPDALGGGAACGWNGGVLLLTSPTALSAPAKQFFTQYGTAYTQVQVFGAASAVSDSVKTAISNLLPK